MYNTRVRPPPYGGERRDVTTRFSGADGLTLVIPSHNEAASLGQVLREWWTHRPEGVAYEILVVDDASTDRTSEVLAQLAPEVPVRTVRNPRSLGFGGALRVGILNTTTTWVAFTDADGQYDPQDLVRLLGSLAEGADMAVGVRSPRADPFIRTVISVGFRGLLFLFFGLRSKDSTCSLRVGRTEAFRAVAQNTRYMNGSFWNEFMVRWTRSGYSFVQTPIRHLPRLDGLSKVASKGLIARVSVQQFIALLRLWREFHRIVPVPSSAAHASSDKT
jgi:glycosyltransferase involved in cell wall biosynthesis